MIYKTENFFVGFDYPATPSGRGKIYLDGEHFANTYIIPADWGNQGGKIAFNRDYKAFVMRCPPIAAYTDLNGLLAELQHWYDTK
jgi:hypothetical protein